MLTRRKFLTGAAGVAVAVPAAVAVSTAVAADNKAHPVFTEDTAAFGHVPLRIPGGYSPALQSRDSKALWPGIKAYWDKAYS